MSRRIVAAALVVGLGSWFIAESGDNVDHYMQNMPSPHSQNGSIPDGKVLPLDATVEFHDGTLEYQAPPEVAARTGLLALTAACGNPVDKRDRHNLYAFMSIRKEDGQAWQVTAGIAAAPACADGTINADDRSRL